MALGMIHVDMFERRANVVQSMYVSLIHAPRRSTSLYHNYVLLPYLVLYTICTSDLSSAMPFVHDGFLGTADQEEIRFHASGR